MGTLIFSTLTLEKICKLNELISFPQQRGLGVLF